MKSQTAKQAGQKMAHRTMVRQQDPATAISESARGSQPAFDDLHAHIAARAYELYVERGYREDGALKDWLDAEREILNAEFPAQRQPT
jgi:hypothetical protein